MHPLMRGNGPTAAGSGTRAGLAPVWTGRVAWLDLVVALAAWLFLAMAGDRRAPATPLIAAGDFNLPDDSAVFRRHWSGLTDAFDRAGTGWGHTKFTRWFGVRIDLVLAGPGWPAAPALTSAPTTAPVVADLGRVGPTP